MSINSTVVSRLFADLKQSYERRHQGHPGHVGDFPTCQNWVCKNAREKLAEWAAELAETAVSV